MIVTAAVKIGNVVYTGRRHDAAHLNATDENGKAIEPKAEHIQGFITSDGTFLNRVQAADHAFVCGQIDKHTTGDELISEQLYYED